MEYFVGHSGSGTRYESYGRPHLAENPRIDAHDEDLDLREPLQRLNLDGNTVFEGGKVEVMNLNGVYRERRVG